MYGQLCLPFSFTFAFPSIIFVVICECAVDIIMSVTTEANGITVKSKI